VPRHFGNKSSDYAWVTLPRPDGNEFRMAYVVHKYAAWIGSQGEWTWPQLIREFCTNDDGAPLADSSLICAASSLTVDPYMTLENETHIQATQPLAWADPEVKIIIII
jgi:hypothetical protein